MDAQAPDRITVRGTVTNRATGEALAAVNVRISGTSRGTITNAEGHYILSLSKGDYQLQFSVLGYLKDSVALHLSGDVRQDVALTASAILLPEIAVSSEDPAIGIIRRAIANKQFWIDRLRSYEMQAFTRQTLYRDTAVAAITEAFTRGYWQMGDTLREVVLQKRQTANLPAADNFASVGKILNFSEDNVSLLGYTFVGPTAVNALEYYDYKLLRTRTGQGQELYVIRMIPATQTVPLFEGTVYIANGSYALVGVDVSPNAAFSIPFVKAKELRYRQEFSLYESTFWLPANIRIEGKFSIRLTGFSFPTIGFAQTSVISDYAINVAIPDSILKKPRLVQDSAATRLDSIYWAEHVVLPLSIDEQKAYATLDSTQSLEVQFRPGGAAFTLGAGSGGVGEVLSHADLWFNRAEGFHLGARFTLDRVLPLLGLHAAAGYAFAPKKMMYELGATVYTSSNRTFGFGGEAYRRADHHPDHGYYSPIYNSLTALVFRNDYRDYFLAEGGRVFLTSSPSRWLFGELSIVAERHRTISPTTNFSWFSRSRSYRPNPAPRDGMLHAIRFDGRIGVEATPLDFVMVNSFTFSVEHADPSLTGGDFAFTRYDGVLSLTIPTFATRFLLKPGFRIRASGGTTSGTPPPQRFFDLESASSVISPLGTMHALNVKEYSGTSYVTLNVEHNFRSLPFLALDIPFLYENEIELIIHGGAAKTWSRDLAGPSNITKGWYSEAGIAIGRIFGVLRLDGTWRVSSPRFFRVTAAVSGLL